MSTTESHPTPFDHGTVGWNFEHTYSRLPADFHADARPIPARAPWIVVLNVALGAELGLDLTRLPADEAAAVFTGQRLPPGSRPLAQAYAGHQFGGFTMLGDGRALLWGEQRTPDGRLVDLQFKGSGPTPFSRRGDGRAALGPMLREYVVSEAMQGLGVPTTRSLAVAATGEPVYREDLLRGAVLTRTAASHLRVGTFQYAAARGDVENLRILADYAIARHDPELTDVAGSDRYVGLLRAVVERQARLIARWQLVGFVHGVMNTDNMAISGETIDYGPCAFLDAYHPETVFSSIDHQGRYAYGNQPGIGQWNLARFAETLLPLIDSDTNRAVERAVAVLNDYPPHFRQAWLAGMRRKLGLADESPDDLPLMEDLLAWMADAGADFTNTFDDLSSDAGPTGGSYDEPRFQAWLVRWRTRAESTGRTLEEVRRAMRAANPAIIPRNHRVEEALAAANEHDDTAPLEQLVAALRRPYERSPETAAYREPPPASSCRYRTFCGT